jgi:DNA repair exonuclease SbcCD ATPase subunit
LIEEERTGAQRDPEREAKFWSKKIVEIEVERRGYQRLAVKGHMTDEELAAELAELDETRETAERELEAARARSETLERLQHDRDTVLESYARMAEEALETLTPEERHRVYQLLRLNVYVRPDWPLEIQGVFANTVDEAEAALSSCKPSPGSFLGDEPPTLNFRALLTEGGAEQLELTSPLGTDRR